MTVTARVDPKGTLAKIKACQFKACTKADVDAAAKGGNPVAWHKLYPAVFHATENVGNYAIEQAMAVEKAKGNGGCGVSGFIASVGRHSTHRSVSLHARRALEELGYAKVADSIPAFRASRKRGVKSSDDTFKAQQEKMLGFLAVDAHNPEVGMKVVQAMAEEEMWVGLGEVRKNAKLPEVREAAAAELAKSGYRD
ncbi:Uncharacterised protein [uncultured archaeon]|nr:Uncharacterised protein [uncultured archaeon]